MIRQLTFTRFIAAFLIVFYHFGKDLLKIEASIFESIRPHFNLGVSYFYTLSGFVMMIAYGKLSKINPRDFYINRIARIYPLHLFSLLLFFIVSILISINYLEYYKFNINPLIAHLLLIQAWIPKLSLSLNVPAWSISVEAFFYLLFPFIFNRFINRNNIRTSFMIIGVFWVICQILMNFYFLSDSYGGKESLDRYFLFYNPFLHFSSFLIGILFGQYFISNPRIPLKKRTDFILLSTVAFCCLIIYWFPKTFFHNGLFAPLFGLLILYFTTGKGFFNRLFSNQKLFYLGEISFAIYLLQNPIYIFMNKVFNVIKFKEPYTIFFVSFIVLLVASHFTFKYIEAPARLKIRRKFGKK